jgi:hypothetical protein
VKKEKPSARSGWQQGVLARQLGHPKKAPLAKRYKYRHKEERIDRNE